MIVENLVPNLDTMSRFYDLSVLRNALPKSKNHEICEVLAQTILLCEILVIGQMFLRYMIRKSRLDVLILSTTFYESQTRAIFSQRPKCANLAHGEPRELIRHLAGWGQEKSDTNRKQISYFIDILYFLKPVKILSDNSLLLKK